MKTIPDLSALVEEELDRLRNRMMSMLDEMDLDGASEASPRTDPPPSSVPDENVGQPSRTIVPPPSKANKKRSRVDPTVEPIGDETSKVVGASQAGERLKKKRKKKKKSAEKSSEPVDENMSHGVDRGSESINDPIASTSPTPLSMHGVSPPVLPSKGGGEKRPDDGEASNSIEPSDRSGASGQAGEGLDRPGPKRPQMECPDRVEFSYDGNTPLIYDLPKCAELVRQIRCGPKGMPTVNDLYFKDDYVDGGGPSY